MYDKMLLHHAVKQVCMLSVMASKKILILWHMGLQILKTDRQI